MLRQGGRTGGPRAEGAIDDFKRAVRMWHAKHGNGKPAVENDLQSDWASTVFDGLRRLAPPPVPKNAKFTPNADHGHLAFPYAWLRQCVAYADAKMAANPGCDYMGLQRDVTVLVLLFVMTRRFDEV